MKKVTLLGDSIRLLGYGQKVPELLGNDFEVYQPEVNCCYAKYTLRGLYDWKDGIAGSDVIHWNNGLWDVCDLFGDGSFSTPEEYKVNILRIASLLIKITPKVIFATTTPVLDNHPCQSNSDIAAQNANVVPELLKMGIVINDLYATVYPHRTEYIREDDQIHLTERGIDVCAEQVAQIIKELAER